MSGKVSDVCISEKKGTEKMYVGTAVLIEDEELQGDAYARFAHRKVSLLNAENITDEVSSIQV